VPGGGELFTLHLKTSDRFTGGKRLDLLLANDPLNEIADANYNLLPGAMIRVDMVESVATGVNDMPAPTELTLTSRPNPFMNYTTISYTLPVDGKVVLQVNDNLGRIVKTFLEETQQSGLHSVVVDVAYLNGSGMYTATLMLQAKGNIMSKTIKLVIIK
jgi:hypothetical protein